uniref:Uncharacterized protein n=1 Tax=Lactuca sativa TaxID=4236 RepID=A0A9R1VKB8_LACSA|nr:hypothetical protein LSAT_V11C400211330 [Lactuca sativa]
MYIKKQLLFLVVRSAHIFVIVFNLKKPSIEILDNSAVEGDYEGKYGVLLKRLVKINHPRANAISKETVITQNLEMPWRIVKNKVDCGKPGLHKESKIQQTTLEKLRKRYVHQMLTSKINMLKAMLLDLAKNIKMWNSQCVLLMHTRLCKQFKKS